MQEYRFFLVLILALGAMMALALLNPVTQDTGDVITGGSGSDCLGAPITDDLTGEK